MIAIVVFGLRGAETAPVANLIERILTKYKISQIRLSVGAQMEAMLSNALGIANLSGDQMETVLSSLERVCGSERIARSIAAKYNFLNDSKQVVLIDSRICTKMNLTVAQLCEYHFFVYVSSDQDKLIDDACKEIEKTEDKSAVVVDFIDTLTSNHQQELHELGESADVQIEYGDSPRRIRRQLETFIAVNLIPISNPTSA